MRKKVFTLCTLGNFGNFGNQLFQVCFGLGLARHFDAELQIPKNWIGYKIFNIKLPEIEVIPIARTPIDYIPTLEQLKKHQRIDLLGFWQFQDAIDFFSKKDIQEWLCFQNWVTEIFPRKTTSKENYKISIHKRRGDYLHPDNINRFCCISNRSFYKCLHENVLPQFEISDDPHILEISEETATSNDYCKSLGIDFFPDFMNLVNSDIIIRSNSSFSFWAAVLGGKTSYSPVVNNCTGWSDVDFIKGNHSPFVYAKYFPNQKISDMYIKDNM